MSKKSILPTVVFVVLILFHARLTSAAPTNDAEGSAELLNIISIYLKAAQSGDYRPLRQFASPDVKPAEAKFRFPDARSATLYGPEGKKLEQYWYISSIIRKPENNEYEIVLEAYMPDESGHGSSSVRAIAKGQNGHYVLTRW